MNAEASAPQHASAGTVEDGIEYVVSMRREGASGLTDGPAWDDIATVTLPKRSQTPTIVLAGIKRAGVSPSLTDRFRVLDGKAARELTVKPKAQPVPGYEVAIVVDGERREIPED